MRTRLRTALRQQHLRNTTRDLTHTLSTLAATASWKTLHRNGYFSIGALLSHTFAGTKKKHTRNFSTTGSNSVRRLEAVEWMCGTGRQQRSSRFAKKNPRLRRRRRRRLRSTPKEHGAIEPVRNSSPTRTHFFTRHTRTQFVDVVALSTCLWISSSEHRGEQLFPACTTTRTRRSRSSHELGHDYSGDALLQHPRATSSLWGWHSRRFEGNNNNTRCRHQHTHTHRTLFSTVVERDDSEDPLRTTYDAARKTTYDVVA